MPRCPARNGNERMKPFKIAPGHRIGDPNKEGINPLKAGDTVHLTEAQARYFLKMGAIQLELDFGDDDKPSDGDKAETGSGAETEGSGDAPSGAASGSDAVPEEGEGKAGGRKRSL